MEKDDADEDYEIAEMLASATMALVLPLYQNYDKNLYCFICDDLDCEWGMVMVDKDIKYPVVVHATCASPYVARRKDSEDQSHEH